MSKILSKDTKPEKRVRSILHSMGYRFRLHDKGLPGKPDIVLKKYKTVIFVHGCFWHLHENCIDGRIPKTRTDYWKEKLYKNKARDKKHILQLQNLGWQVLKVWECEVEKTPDKVSAELDASLRHCAN